MAIQIAAHWHKLSYEKFLNDSLPGLLAERLPLTGYQMQPASPTTCKLSVTIAASTREVLVEFPAIPQMDEEGLFQIEGHPLVVVPTVTDENLDTARIACAGEQLLNIIQEKLGAAPADLPWDEALVNAWLPLDTWINAFLHDQGQKLDTTNWISRNTHLRRLIVLKRTRVITPGQAGRVCPFEVPEGPNIGRIFTIALGAAIQDGQLIIIDPAPEATLGISASMLPFMEHNDPNRVLFAANMMRQGIVSTVPEPAWVQTGNEPDAPGFWCGRNLLTAFVSWDEGTSEDGILISQSAARRMADPFPIAPGDKLSNRHGSKGVISAILPDEKMPHLLDGTPVELVFNFIGLRTRMNFGQVREALFSQLALAEGAPVIVPPFHAPADSEIRERLASSGVPESGMEMLTDGSTGRKLERPATTGWVYWLRLYHVSETKLRVSTGQTEGQVMGELECDVLRKLGALRNLEEILNTRSARHPGATCLEERAHLGPIEPANTLTPMAVDLLNRLQIAGIQADLHEGHLSFHMGLPTGEKLKLAQPVAHPWNREIRIDTIGTPAGASTTAVPGSDLTYPAWSQIRPDTELTDSFSALGEANTRLARLLTGGAPERLIYEARARLKEKLSDFFNTLLPSSILNFDELTLFSGRAVAAPGFGLQLDQVGLPEDMAWAFFGPLVARQLADKTAVNADNPEAVETLDAIMAHQWVVVHRPPALALTSLLAFHPVRDPGKVIRLNPMVCTWLNADFDGDQLGVFLPLTAGAQQEAGDLLSVAGQLAHHPELMASLSPVPESCWGLAYLSLSEAGRAKLNSILGEESIPTGQILSRDRLAALKASILAKHGTSGSLRLMEQLDQAGFAAAKASGASMSPFLGSSLQLPPAPNSESPREWETYITEISEKILSLNDYTSLDMGPQSLDSRIRIWVRQALPRLVAPLGLTEDATGQPVIVRHSFTQGLTPGEMMACVAGARQGLANWAMQSESIVLENHPRGDPASLNVLSRARRSKHPGIVFARAAANGEVDPLEDVESRLLVGLPVE